MKMTTFRSLSIGYISIGIEMLWLAAAFLVPLIIAPADSMVSYLQLPKIALLRTLVSLMVILWAVQWTIKPQDAVLPRSFKLSKSLWEWVFEKPTRVMLVATTTYIVVYLLSAVISVSFSVSLWGNPTDVDNYGVYNMLTYFMLFLIIATHLRKQSQLWRLVGAIVASGAASSLLGTLEYLQWIPLGEVRANEPRIASTFGNSIFFAAFLVLTIPMSVAFILRRWRAVDYRATYTFGISLLIIQLLALLLTLSRGPWVGLAVGLVGFILVAPFMLDRRIILKSALMLFVGLALATGIMRALPTPAERDPLEDSTRANELNLEDRLFSIYGQVSGGGLNNRLEIWESSRRLIAERPWFSSKSAPLSFFRPAFGYGPGLYAYVFPLEAVELIGFQFHAHNHVIHEAVDIGFVGALTYLIFVSSIFISGIMLIKDKAFEKPEFKLIVFMILVAVAARFVEELVGIAKVGDTMLFWMLLGLLVAIPNVIESSEESRETASFNSKSFETVSVAKVCFASIIVIFLAGLIVTRNVNHVRADIAMANAYKTNSFDQALSLSDKAAKLAPYLPTYYVRGYDIVRNAPASMNTSEQKTALAEKAYANAAFAVEADPLWTTAQLKLANASLNLNRMGYEGFEQEAVDIYQELIDSTPHMNLLHNHLWTLMSIAYLETGRAKEGLESIGRVRLDNLNFDQRARVLYLKGLAQNELGHHQEAVISLNAALSIEPEQDYSTKAEAHLLLSRIFDELGDSIQSENHARQYAEFSPNSGG